MKTIETREKKEQQVKEVNDRVIKWKNKFHFSFATLLFSVFLLGYYTVNQFMGHIPTVILSLIVLVFIQQSIRSYNYFKFHRVTYRALKMLHEKFEK